MLLSHASVICLVGGVTPQTSDLIWMKQQADYLIGVDGGTNHLLKFEQIICPDLIIGDLDSLENRNFWVTKTKIQQQTNQDTTDLEKALFQCPPRVIICLGFIGQRFDQTLTTLHACIRFPGHKFLFLSEIDAIATLPKAEFKLCLPKGSRLSVYPIKKSKFGSGKGLLYPLDGLTLDQGYRIGTSNQVAGAGLAEKNKKSEASSKQENNPEQRKDQNLTKVTINMIEGLSLIILDKKYKTQLLDTIRKHI